MMKKPGYLAFLLLFFFLLALPVSAMLLGYQAENRENRPLARRPELTDRQGQLNLSFPSAFDRYFEDHFGLREEMVTAFHALTMAALSDTLNEKVVVGKAAADGERMLYYADTMKDYLGTDVLGDEDIARIAASLRLQQEFALENGARFAFMIAPNKNTVYPEYMPGRFLPAPGARNLEKLYAALKAQGVQTVDVLSAFLARKDEGMLYHTHDTHWNDKGAGIAFQAMMRAIYPELSGTMGFTTLEPEWVYDHAGDLHNFVLPAVKANQPRPRYEALDALYGGFQYDAGARPLQDVAFATAATGGAPIDGTLMMMRDSFALSLIPLFSTQFSRVVYSSEFPYHYNTVQSERPHAILIELVERNIETLLLSAPLMPAIEKAMPPPPEEVMHVTAAARQNDGYTELFGCFEGGYAGPVYVMLAGQDTYCFEAFPILEEQADDMAAQFTAPQGFTLTLPASIKGEFTLTVQSGARAGQGGVFVIE